MTEPLAFLPLLSGLARQTLWLSAWIGLVALLRPCITRAFGATARLALWALVPAGLLVPLLPAPTHPVASVIHWQWSAVLNTDSAAAAARWAADGHGVPGAATALGLAALWALGLIGGVLVMLQQQRRYLRTLRWDCDRGCWRSPAGSSPAEAGLWQRRLVLPADFEQRYSPAEQALVLAHEACHHARRDNAWRLLGLAVALMHWFNPVAWWALGRLRQDQELACDASVLAARPAGRAVYLQALLKSHAPATSFSPWAASAWIRSSSPHPLIERVQMLPQHLRHHHRRHWGLGLIAVLGLLGASFVHAQQASGKASTAARPVSVSMNLLVNGRPAGSPTVLVKTGESATLGIDQRDTIADSSPWQLSLQVVPQADGRLRLNTRISGGEPLSARGEPSFVTEPGQPIEFFVRDGSGQQVLQVRELTLRWAPER